MGWLVLASWVVTIALSYLWVGGFLGAVIEGQNRALLSKLPLLFTGVAALVSLCLTLAWSSGSSPAADAQRGRSRRRFLLGAVSAVAGLAASGAAVVLRNLGWVTVTGRNITVRVPTQAPEPRAAWEGARVREYRRLGRTGFGVSDVSLGSSRIHPARGGEEIARTAIERGVNYLDTAPDYAQTGSETALGRAMRGHRERLFVATKFCTAQGHLPAGTSVRDYMAAVEGSLQRLQTDHVDLVHVHACNSLERLMDPGMHEAFDRLREQGKARFLGVSTHTPNLEAVATRAIESGRFDVLMLAYHHGAWANLAHIIDRAHRSDVGVVAMKTLKGAKHEGLDWSRDERDSYTQAAFKWVLQNPSVSCLVISFSRLAHIDEYLFASGQRPTGTDHALLRRYDEQIAGTYCRPHCGACLASCPFGAPIDDVLRYRMYFEDYSDEKEALRLYAGLERGAELCAGCSAPCAGSCPHGIPIQQRMIGAHELLTLS